MKIYFQHFVFNTSEKHHMFIFESMNSSAGYFKINHNMKILNSKRQNLFVKSILFSKSHVTHVYKLN